MSEKKKYRLDIPSRKSYEQRISELKEAIYRYISKLREQGEDCTIDSSLRTKNPKLYNKAVSVVYAWKKQNGTPITVKTVFEACGFKYNSKSKNYHSTWSKEEEGELYAKTIMNDLKKMNKKYELNKKNSATLPRRVYAYIDDPFIDNPNDTFAISGIKDAIEEGQENNKNYSNGIDPFEFD